jgi:hypothetical protein
MRQERRSLSYDLMVFDPAAASRGRKAFMKWFARQTRWAETHGYDNPDVPTAPLRRCFAEISRTFPPLNGPLAGEDVDDPRVTDYSLGRTVIAAFGWSQAEAAYARVKELAARHSVGFSDANSGEADIRLPTPSRGLEKSR